MPNNPLTPEDVIELVAFYSPQANDPVESLDKKMAQNVMRLCINHAEKMVFYYEQCKNESDEGMDRRHYGKWSEKWRSALNRMKGE